MATVGSNLWSALCHFLCWLIFFIQPLCETFNSNGCRGDWNNSRLNLSRSQNTYVQLTTKPNQHVQCIWYVDLRTNKKPHYWGACLPYCLNWGPEKHSAYKSAYPDSESAAQFRTQTHADPNSDMCIHIWMHAAQWLLWDPQVIFYGWTNLVVIWRPEVQNPKGN